MRRVLVVDDEENIRLVLRTLLKKNDYQVEVAESAEAALDKLERFDPDFVLADVRMTGMTGIELCTELKARSSLATVILMSAYGSTDLAIEAMKAGAYDYISKPFSPRQLVARVKTVLRRTAAGRINKDEPYVFQQLSFDPELRTLTRQGQEPNRLTRLEARLLDTLMLNQGQIIPVDTLIAHVWGPDGGSAEMLRQLIHRLRQKIEVDPEHPELIQNAPGIGYGFGL